MSPKAPRKQNLVLAYDLGGTKIAAGVVTSTGRIVASTRVPAEFHRGKKAVIGHLCELGKNFLKRYPGIRRVGMASAGPLDPKRGLLLDPTNFVSSEGGWGKVPIASILSKNLKRPVRLENDAAAAVLAERWKGAAKNCDNAVILTLGTGLGVGVIANGKLVRAGRGLHPEGGHILLNYEDESARCGCGNQGCAEAYLSGGGFTRRARQRLGNPTIRAEEVAERARREDAQARELFDEYSTQLASAIQTFIVLYAPEIVVLTGSFAGAADLFLTQTHEKLTSRVQRRRVGMDLLPRLEVSPLQNQAGLLGGAYIALHHDY